IFDTHYLADLSASCPDFFHNLHHIHHFDNTVSHGPHVASMHGLIINILVTLHTPRGFEPVIPTLVYLMHNDKHFFGYFEIDYSYKWSFYDFAFLANFFSIIFSKKKLN
ncbi:hypothetical protein ACJX0J_035776, partial [Zea mays]